MDIAILGAGSWGSALALLLADNGHTVRIWARDSELVTALASDRENRRYLPGFPFPPSILPTLSLEETKASEVVIFAVPSGGVRKVAYEGASYLREEAVVLSGSKGLEEGTGLRMSEVLAETLPQAKERIVVLSGPNLAVEVARGVPTASVAASSSNAAARQIQRLFIGQPTPTFRVYTSRDVVGVELGGAIKNVIAIGAGVCDGMGFGDNSKAAFLTRGLTETIRLGVAQGADSRTFLVYPASATSSPPGQAVSPVTIASDSRSVRENRLRKRWRKSGRLPKASQRPMFSALSPAGPV